MIQTASESPIAPHFNNATSDTARRRSTFYVPLVINQCSVASSPLDGGHDTKATSTDQIYNPDLSACSFEWSLNESSDLLVGDEVKVNSAKLRDAGKTPHSTPTKDTKYLCDARMGERKKRYGVVLNGINLDDDGTGANDENHNVSGERPETQSISSTPVKLLKSRSRSNILYFPEKSLQLSPMKEKSKTLPQNASPKLMSIAIDDSSTDKSSTGCAISVLPSKYSLLLKSSPKISINLLSDSQRSSQSATSPTPSTAVPHFNDHKTTLSLSPSSATSPRKGLSFIRRTHSTKLSRSNSLLKSLTSKCVDQDSAKLINGQPICELPFEQFEKYFKSENFHESIKNLFLKDDNNSDSISDKREKNKVLFDDHLSGKLTTFDIKCNDADEVYSGKFFLGF